MTETLSPYDTLLTGRAWVMAHAEEPGGVLCPCCNGRAAIYHRKLNSSMAWALLQIARIGEERRPVNGWIHVHNEFVPRGINPPKSEYNKLAYWGLLEEGQGGLWRLTPRGWDFLWGRIRVPHIAVLFQGGVIRCEGPDISIQDAFGDRLTEAERAGWKTRPRQPFGTQMPLFGEEETS